MNNLRQIVANYCALCIIITALKLLMANSK